MCGNKLLTVIWLFRKQRRRREPVAHQTIIKLSCDTGQLHYFDKSHQTQIRMIKVITCNIELVAEGIQSIYFISEAALARG